MRCPKCHYLSFDPEPRCKNCGYGFSLAESDLMLKDSEPASDELVDLDLRPAPSPDTLSTDFRASAVASPSVESPRPAKRRVTSARERDDESNPFPVPPAPPIVATRPSPVRVQPAPTSELPLFVKGLAAAEDDHGAHLDEPPMPMPQVRVSSEPRAPLGVRRKATDGTTPRPRSTNTELRKLGPLDRDLLEDLKRIESLDQPPSTLPIVADLSHADDRVGAGRRAAAAALDAVLMGGLATGVLAITLRWCELPLERATSLPIVPTLAFLLLVGAGYVLMFTAAGGQTIGKMAFGIRVVNDETPDHGLTVRQAVYRSLLSLPSMLALGAGFFPALLGDERALHDRLAHTRVVRA